MNRTPMLPRKPALPSVGPRTLARFDSIDEGLSHVVSTDQGRLTPHPREADSPFAVPRKPRRKSEVIPQACRRPGRSRRRLDRAGRAFVRRGERRDAVEPQRDERTDRPPGRHRLSRCCTSRWSTAAMYDAVNAIDGGYTPYLVSPDATPFDSQDAAAATAAYYVLKSILPCRGSRRTHDDAQYDDADLRSPVSPTVRRRPRDRRRGRRRERDDPARTGDGRFGACCFTVPAVPGPGDWRPLASGNDPNGWIRT